MNKTRSAVLTGLVLRLMMMSAPLAACGGAQDGPAGASGSPSPGPATSPSPAPAPVPSPVPSPAPSPTPSAPAATYVGCYVDSSTARAFPLQLAGAGATVQSCVSAAIGNGLAYAGLQYGKECWGGNTLSTAKVSDSECSMPCEANPSQQCGASYRNSVYATGFVPGSPSPAPAPAPPPGPPPSGGYSTSFAHDEYPLSEGGAWKHTGLKWTQVIVENGLAHGTETGSRPGDSQYDDSYAYLSGFSANQSAEATLFIDPSLANAGGGNREVELLLRWSDSANNAAGYEINLHYLGNYTQIVRWDGPLGRYTYLSWGNTPRPKTGDKFKATIIGNQIVVYLNGVEINRATDTTYATGNPGMAFYVDPGTANGGYGFTSYGAQSLP